MAQKWKFWTISKKNLEHLIFELFWNSRYLELEVLELLAYDGCAWVVKVSSSVMRAANSRRPEVGEWPLVGFRCGCERLEHESIKFTDFIR